MTDSARMAGWALDGGIARTATAASARQHSNVFTRVAHAVVLSCGWKRAAIAFGAGAISALAMAPFHAWPVLFITFPVLVWLIDGASGRYGRAVGAAWVGWCFGFGYFVAGLYWIGIAFLVDAKTFAWLLPFAVMGLPAYLALFTAAGAGLAGLLWSPGAARILALAAAMMVAEWLRGYVLTGFPWNAFGYALAAPLPLAQTASLIGISGLTLVAVAVFAAPAVLADDQAHTRNRWIPVALAGLVLAAMSVFGLMRLYAGSVPMIDGVKLRIMQPNLSQDAKFNYRAKAEVMARYVAMSERVTGPANGGLEGITHLIWPESAFPFLLAREPDALAQIADLLPTGTVLITGAARAAETRANSRPRQAFNSIYVIDHDGSILSVYDKVHLVPFGEYLPFQSLLESLGLRQLTKQQGGFAAADRRRSLPIPRAPAAVPLICYEVAFPDELVPQGERPHWLLNVTNDGWFGNSTGPYQHFHQARLRAIELGVPLVRSANTGISGVVDPFGRVVASLPLGSEGVLDAGLPARLPPTIFAGAGSFWLWLLVAGLLMYSAIVRVRRG
jgi:apolipoprotein N-acyltransferase